MSSHEILAIIIMILVTAALRFAPFIIFNSGRKTPKAVIYLGKALPPAIMGMLVIYCLKDVSIWNADGPEKVFALSALLPPLIASASVVLSYIWKKNTLLSIILGTGIYMLLIRLF